MKNAVPIFRFRVSLVGDIPKLRVISCRKAAGFVSLMQIEPYAAVVSTENNLASITASDCRRPPNKEIRRRTRVVGIFPNEASYMRLVCSYILEYAEDWAYERVYLSPESLRKMLEDPVESVKEVVA